MDLKIIRSLNEFKELEPEWNNLFSSSELSTPFLTYAWVLSSISFTDVKPLVICCYKNKKLVFVLPLKYEAIKFLGLNILKFITHACDKYTDYCGFLIRDEEKKSAKKIIKKVVSCIEQELGKADFIKLDNISSAVRENRIFLKLIRDAEFAKTVYPNVFSPTLKLAESDWVDLKQLKDVERRAKKLKAERKLEFRIGEVPEYESNSWNKLVAMHKEAFPQEGFNQSESQKFYESVLKKTKDQSIFEFSYLLVDEEIAACHFGFKLNGKIYYYVPAYSRKFKKNSIGMILLSHMVNKYKEDGYNEFDFLRGGEPYKTAWMSDEHCNMSVVGIPRGKILIRLIVDIFLFKKSSVRFAR